MKKSFNQTIKFFFRGAGLLSLALLVFAQTATAGVPRPEEFNSQYYQTRFRCSACTFETGCKLPDSPATGWKNCYSVYDYTGTAIDTICAQGPDGCSYLSLDKVCDYQKMGDPRCRQR